MHAVCPLNAPPLSRPSLMLFLFSKVENSQKGGRKREMPPGGGSSGGASEVIMPRGYWGEPTATIDWCEKNYEVSKTTRENMATQRRERLRQDFSTKNCNSYWNNS